MNRAVLALALLSACWRSGDPATEPSPRATLEAAEITTCVQACDRIQQCAALTGRPSHAPRAECQQKCLAMAEDSQLAYARQIGAETVCARIEPFVFLE